MTEIRIRHRQCQDEKTIRSTRVTIYLGAYILIEHLAIPGRRQSVNSMTTRYSVHCKIHSKDKDALSVSFGMAYVKGRNVTSVLALSSSPCIHSND